MEIFIKESTNQEDSMEKGSTFGQMEHIMMVILWMDIVKDRVNGNPIRKEVGIFILESIRKIRRMDLEDIHGIMDANMKETLIMTSSKLYIIT